MKNILEKKGSGIGAQDSAGGEGTGSSDSGQSGIGFWKMIDFSGLKRGISFGLGLISVLATSALIAVAVTGTINTFSSGNVVDASQINTNFASLKSAVEGITSSQWTGSGSNIYYNAGNIGIGTNNPVTKMEVTGSIFSTGYNTTVASGKGVEIFYHTGLDLGYIQANDYTTSTPKKLVLNPSNGANVGIGSMTPSSKLSIGQNTTLPAVLSVRDYGGSGFSYVFYFDLNSGASPFTFNTTGNVGIGTSSQTEKLEVVGDIKVGTTGTNGCLKNFGGGTITGTCSSDEKLKKDIQPMGSVLDKVSQLVPKTYHWRSEEYPNKKFGTQLEYGLVAQDVEKIFPDMVEKDANGLKAIHYERLPILSVQAIKELTFRLGSVTEKLDHEKSVSSDLSLRLGKMTDENARLRERISSLEETVKTRYIVSQNASLELQKLSERLNTLEKMQVVKK